MRSKNVSWIKKGALVLCIGALPFIFNASAYAIEKTEPETKKSTADWLWEDYRKPVGFTYGAQARLQAAYLWRGLYAGGPNIQASANVGYGGLYADLWWNLGVYHWGFNSFEPEVDVTIGFSRWGLNVYALYIHFFDCAYFDFTNYTDIGNRLEVGAKYTLSPKVPLTIYWASRVAAADGYNNSAGETVRAFSSYLEISYTQNFKYDISLYGAVGMTPWKSCYTEFIHDFAVVNVELRLRKDWSISKRCGMMLQGQLSIHPTLLADDPKTAQWKPYAPFSQSVNANLSWGVYLK